MNLDAGGIGRPTRAEGRPRSPRYGTIARCPPMRHSALRAPISGLNRRRLAAMVRRYIRDGSLFRYNAAAQLGPMCPSTKPVLTLRGPRTGAFGRPWAHGPLPRRSGEPPSAPLRLSERKAGGLLLRLRRVAGENRLRNPPGGLPVPAGAQRFGKPGAGDVRGVAFFRR